MSVHAFLFFFRLRTTTCLSCSFSQAQIYKPPDCLDCECEPSMSLCAIQPFRAPALEESNGCPICLDDDEAGVVELCLGVRPQNDARTNPLSEESVHGVCEACLPLYVSRKPRKCLICRSEYGDVYENAANSVTGHGTVESRDLMGEDSDAWIRSMYEYRTRSNSTMSESWDAWDEHMQQAPTSASGGGFSRARRADHAGGPSEDSLSGSDDEDIVALVHRFRMRRNGSSGEGLEFWDRGEALEGPRSASVPRREQLVQGMFHETDSDNSDVTVHVNRFWNHNSTPRRPRSGIVPYREQLVQSMIRDTDSEDEDFIAQSFQRRQN